MRRPAAHPEQRIAFVSDAVYPFNRGGKEMRLHEITRRLVREGRDVRIYTMKWWQGDRSICLDGVWLEAIGKHHALYAGKRRSIKQALLFGLATLRLLTKPFDVVDVDQIPFFPLLAARLVCSIRRKPMYGTWHELWGEEYWKSYLGRLGTFASAMERLCVRAPLEIISNSALTTERLQQMLPGLRVRTVPLGVDFEHLRCVPASRTSTDVLYAGRLLGHKHVDALVLAIALARRQKPGIRGLIVGEGPERAPLEDLVARLGLAANVPFMDFRSEHDEVIGLMKSSKVFVLPSEREGFGIVVLEANACGLPVVTVQQPGNAARHLITDGENGYVVDLDPQDLAAAILRCLDHPQALCPRATVERRFGHNDWPAVARRVERILVGAAGGGPRLAAKPA